MKNGPYTLLIAPENYPGKKYRDRYVYEHHLVWWKNKGTLVPTGFEIHHKNGDHRDNRIKNLQILTSKEHKAIHAQINKNKALREILCGFCEVKFYLRSSTVKTRLKKRKFGKLFCSTSCGAKYQFRGARKDIGLPVKQE